MTLLRLLVLHHMYLFQFNYRYANVSQTARFSSPKAVFIRTKALKIQGVCEQEQQGGKENIAGNETGRS